MWRHGRFLYAFREREDLMTATRPFQCTHACGLLQARRHLPRPSRHNAKYQVNRLRSNSKVRRLNQNREGSLLDFIDDFTQRFPSCVDEYETLLTDNRIGSKGWSGLRCKSERAKALGLPGPCCVARRGVGFAQNPALRGL